MEGQQGESDRIAFLEATDQTYSTCDIMNGNSCIPCQNTIGLDGQIATARKVLADAQDSLWKLLKDKHALRAERNQLHDPIVSQLPPELISKIFEACVENREPSIWQWELSPKTCTPHTVSPLVLGSVCQQWNHIAWSSPSLWTHIYIQYHGQKKDRYIEGVGRWLQRSGSLPLCIFLHLHYQFLTEDSIPAFVRLIEIVGQHQSQWRDIYMVDNPSWFNPELLFCGPSRTRIRLRSLAIVLNRRDSFTNPVEDVELLELYPTRLKLKDVDLNVANIRWSDITDLDLVNVIRLDECVELLRNAPQLVTCHFDLIRNLEAGWRTSASLSEHTVHYALQELTLQRYDGADIEMFLQQFTFPKLLRLTLVKFHDPNLLSALASLLGRSSPPLSYLRIREIDFGTSELIKMLQNAPLLLNLELFQIGIFGTQTKEGDSFLKTLIDAFNRHLLLPKLETVYFAVNRGGNMWTPPSWELVAILCEALSIGRPLKSLLIQGGHRRKRESDGLCDDSSILSRLVKISQSGIDLQLYDISGNKLLKLSVDKNTTVHAK